MCKLYIVMCKKRSGVLQKPNCYSNSWSRSRKKSSYTSLNIGQKIKLQDRMATRKIIFKKIQNLATSWHESDILQTFNQVMNSQRQSLDPMSDSHIVLIPKKMGATEVKDFRPISLINLIQKCFSKLLANQLQHLIAKLIALAQTWFLKDRNINKGKLVPCHLKTLNLAKCHFKTLTPSNATLK
jgi:hypothetical protein